MDLFVCLLDTHRDLQPWLNNGGSQQQLHAAFHAGGHNRTRVQELLSTNQTIKDPLRPFPI